jgi:hypothetical protein
MRRNGPARSWREKSVAAFHLGRLERCFRGSQRF